jgi:hypothetical protein
MTTTTIRGPETETWKVGDLAWVRVGPTGPAPVRGQRCLAVYAQPVGSRDWMLLVPKDGTTERSGAGWEMRGHLTTNQMTMLNVERFVGSHLGWWPVHVEVIERALGYWCATHVVFHAADTCPPETLDDAMTRMYAAEERARRAEQDLRDFKDKASAVLAEGADSHDLCEAYDDWAVRAGLNPRPRDHDVEITISYHQTVTLNGTSWQEAKARVLALAKDNSWDPGLPLDHEDDMFVDVGTPYSIAVSADD